jgi:MoxR-like ATPase
MKKTILYVSPSQMNGTWIFTDIYTGNVMNVPIRDIMAEKAEANNQLLAYDTETGRARRVEASEVSDEIVVQPKTEIVETPMEDPILNFIHNEAVKLKPNTIIMPDLKWKYLVRSAVRGKNIMMTGPAGCGKTQAAKSLVKALDRPDFYFNLGATQDPRGTLIGNTHFKKESGTTFCESVFVKAIQTKDAVILLDELSRAHPEAWNILMTVLDQGQRYLRLDEHENAPTIEVAEGVTFIATANIGTEYTATRAMDRALVDRFIIVEMDVLDKDQEIQLLKMIAPTCPDNFIDTIAEIASITRKEITNESSKISSAISTRLTVEMAGLIADGFNLSEAAEVCIYPFYDQAGGVDSERTYVKQIVQKYCQNDSDTRNIFGTDAKGGSPLPF